jgi:DNA-binding NarL/FixJ family response regulator
MRFASTRADRQHGSNPRLQGSASIAVVLLDFDLGADCGTAFIGAARRAGYQGQFLIVAAAADAHKAALALKQGASGVLLKSEPASRLVKAIKIVADAEVWIEPKVVQMLADQLVNRDPQIGANGSAPELEDKERNVLLGILGGLTNRKIGDNMGISESSVKNIVQRLFRKAGVKKRSQLVRVALEGSLGATRQLMNGQSATAKMHNTHRLTPIEPAPIEQSH